MSPVQSDQDYTDYIIGWSILSPSPPFFWELGERLSWGFLPFTSAGNYSSSLSFSLMSSSSHSLTTLLRVEGVLKIDKKGTVCLVWTVLTKLKICRFFYSIFFFFWNLWPMLRAKYEIGSCWAWCQEIKPGRQTKYCMYVLIKILWICQFLVLKMLLFDSKLWNLTCVSMLAY